MPVCHSVISRGDIHRNNHVLASLNKMYLCRNCREVCLIRFSMTYRSIAIIFLVISWFSLRAAEWVPITSQKNAPAVVTLVSSKEAASVVRFVTPGFHLTKVATPQGDAFRISIEGGTYLLEAGAPDLPKLTASLMVHGQEEMQFRVLSYQYKDIKGIFLAPSKGNLTRDIDPATVPYVFGKTYDAPGFYPGELASLHEPYILRDTRGQALWAFPFQYDASNHTLRVYYEIEVEVTPTGQTGYNTLSSNGSQPLNEEFHHIYQRHYLNYPASKYTPLEENGKMLIISHGPFMSAMQPFVEWKNKSGIPTELVSVSSIGTTAAAIKTYVQNYYTTQGLTFLLLVGDAMHVPTITATSGHSDNSYGYLVGNDSYPEIFVGRFSAESLADVETQVMRTLAYERDPNPAASHFNRSLGIASDEGPGDDNEMDYTHVRNMLTDLLGYHYNYGAEHYEGSQGGNDLPGNPTAAMVSTELNNGTGVILYTGHGSTTSWGTTGFANSHINALNNGFMLPFIWAVACVNGNFVNNTCFAEAWLRAKSGDMPTGAVATLMSTINQSWDPPMEGQDEMVDILVESYATNIKRTFGGISMNGCMKMNDTYGSGGTEMTDTWNLFGDPSLRVRTDTPQVLSATHLPTLLLGSGQFNVNCPVNGSLATLSLNGQILSSQIITNGSVNMSFSPILVMDTLDLVITGYNRIPYIAQIPVIPATGPYVLYCQHTLSDSLGNLNGLADYGETVSLNLSLQNLGILPASMVSISLQTSDPYVTLLPHSAIWNSIGAGDTSQLLAVSQISIAAQILDLHQVWFNVVASDTAGQNWNSMFSLTLHAPVLSLGDYILDDQAGGNGDGLADPGETINFSIPARNQGHSSSPAASLLLASTSPHLTIDTNMTAIPAISANGQAWAMFTLHIDSTILPGSVIDLHAFLDAGSYQHQTTRFVPVGITGEDFETGDFTRFPWAFGGSANWLIDTQNPFQGSFSARSGVIPNNTATEMSLSVNVLASDSISFYRKVSSESGYDFLEFYIDNTKVDQWSGEAPWGRKAYAVAAGPRTFKWRYVKDWYMTGGSDRAWVDNIVFPPVAVQSIPFSASIIATPSGICEGESAQLIAVTSTSGPAIQYQWSPSSSLNADNISNPIASPLTSTAYMLTVISGTDTATASVNLTVFPLPAKPIISLNGTTLVSSAPFGNQWFDQTGPIPGATGSTYTPVTGGTYYVQVQDQNGCLSPPSDAIVYSPAGIDEWNSLISNFLVHPNPAGEYVEVSYRLRQSAMVSIQLVDIVGRVHRTLYSGELQQGLHQMTYALEGMEPGLYLLKMNTPQEQAVQRLMIR